MGSFYTPNFPYDENTFIDNNLTAYTLTDNLYGMLDQVREIIASKKYFFQGTPFPTGADCFINGLDTFSGNITVPALSMLVALSGDSFYSPAGDGHTGRNLSGFTTRIYDKGAKLDTVVNSLYAENFANIGVMANVFTPNDQTNVPIGPLFLQTPMVILEPGSLQIEITNLSPFNIFAQIFLLIAVPLNRQSTSEQLIGVGTNKRN